MIVDKLGWYRTVDGSLAHVEYRTIYTTLIYPFIGYWFRPNGTPVCQRWWTKEGRSDLDSTRDVDLVEYLGPDKPKQKVKKLFYPALVRQTNGNLFVTTTIYKTEHEAINSFSNPDKFVRWLNEDRYGIEVEVEE
jgi:hypothetical protein